MEITFIKIKDWVHQKFHNGIDKWYLQTWFICLCFVFWFYIIPLFVGIVLLVLQQDYFMKRQKNVWCNVELTAEQLNFAEKTRAESILELENAKIEKEKIIAAVKAEQEIELEASRKKANTMIYEAQGYEREVFRRCGEIKTKVQEDCRLLKIDTENECIKIKAKVQEDCRLLKVDTDNECVGIKFKTKVECRALRADTESECRATKLNEKRMAEDIKNKWQQLKIFTDEHYEKIKQMENETLKKIDEMANGHDFEYFFAEMLKSAGYVKVEVTKGSGDMGADIIAIKNGVKYAIQCKRYTYQVDTSAVQQVLSGLQYYHCHVGIVVTNSTYTQGAIELAAQTQVVLWDRHMLQRMVSEYCKNIYIKQF